MVTKVPMQATSMPFVSYFYRWEQEKANQVYLRQAVGSGYVDYTWAEVGQQVRRMATYLQSLGLPPGSHIGLISKNCPHWLIADLAILISGHVSVPFYPTLTEQQLQSVLEHSGCRVLFVGKVDTWQTLKTGVPTGTTLIAFPGCQYDPALQDWHIILATHLPMINEFKVQLDDLFTIIYTSGTTGAPKGVMVSYRAAARLAEMTRVQTWQTLPNARFFSYLPLCHVAERNIVEAIGLITGGTIYFPESLATFAKNLAAARPTHFLAVPRIWTKFQQAVLSTIPQKRLNWLLELPLVASAVKRRIRKRLGLNDAVLILTGAAPTPIALIEWFRRLGIRIQENYGMTENLGAISMMPPGRIKDGTVGRINPGVEIKIEPTTGEIWTRVDWTMVGYYREPALTANTLTDERWMRTGDIGEIDDEGYLRVTGRLNELYKSVKGEFINPSLLESSFQDNPLVNQVCVLGRTLPQPIALIGLADIGIRADPKEIEKKLVAIQTVLNDQVQSYERIQKIVIVKDTWTVDNKMMTPTMKNKRMEIENRYHVQVEQWYYAPEPVIWEDE